jgi:PAS domain S-box-containing protein
MTKRIYFLFALIFLVLFTAVYVHRRSLSELDKSIEWVDHTYQVTGFLNKLKAEVLSAQLHSTSNPADNHLVTNDFVDMISDLKAVEPLLTDEMQKDCIDTIDRRVSSWRELLAIPNALQDSVVSRQITSNISSIEATIDITISKQQQLLGDKNVVIKAIVKSLHRWTIILIALAFALVLFTSYYGYKQLKNRIDLEVLLESILNASQEGIITCKTLREGFKIEDFEILFANNAVNTHLGIESADIIGKSIFYIMPEIQSSGLLAKWIQVVEDGHPDEYEALHKDPITGNENWYSVKLVKLADGVTMTFHNITELRSYQQNLNTDLRT